MNSDKQFSPLEEVGFEKELSILTLPPKEFAMEIKKLNMEVQSKVKFEEVERKASVIAAVLSSIIFTVLMSLVITIISY